MHLLTIYKPIYLDAEIQVPPDYFCNVAVKIDSLAAASVAIAQIIGNTNHTSVIGIPLDLEVGQVSINRGF